MTNIISGKKCVHSFNRDVANELGHISQVHKILKTLVKKGEIVSFDRRPKGLDNSLTYQIFYNNKRQFDVILCATKIKLLNGADIAESRGWKLVIFLDKNCKPKRIQSILVENIKERKDGLLVEKTFQENMLTLITRDKEVSQVIKSIRIAEDYEDAIRKTDFFLVLKNKKEVPIQIKSSISGQVKHKKHCSGIPSLVYNNKLPEDFLKEKVLQICKSYPNIIEHL